MELQLGLALSLLPTQMITSCFDLKQAMASSQHGSSGSSPTCGRTLKRKKRTFIHIGDDQKRHDQLSFRHNQPNEEDDDDDENHSSTANNRDEEDEDGVVGWPPIKSWRRKKKCRRYQQQRWMVVVGEDDHELCRMKRRRSSYVKVKMEGVTITRKVDLSQHNSFASLSTTLLSMFGISVTDSKSSNYELTYEDKDGDWLLAEDVPWRTFEESVQRLKLRRCL